MWEKREMDGEGLFNNNYVTNLEMLMIAARFTALLLLLNILQQSKRREDLGRRHWIKAVRLGGVCHTGGTFMANLA